MQNAEYRDAMLGIAPLFRIPHSVFRIPHSKFRIPN